MTKPKSWVELKKHLSQARHERKMIEQSLWTARDKEIALLIDYWYFKGMADAKK